MPGRHAAQRKSRARPLPGHSWLVATEQSSPAVALRGFRSGTVRTSFSFLSLTCLRFARSDSLLFRETPSAHFTRTHLMTRFFLHRFGGPAPSRHPLVLMWQIITPWGVQKGSHQVDHMCASRLGRTYALRD